MGVAAAAATDLSAVDARFQPACRFVHRSISRMQSDSSKLFKSLMSRQIHVPQILEPRLADKLRLLLLDHYSECKVNAR
jgi:hypothetical protein